MDFGASIQASLAVGERCCAVTNVGWVQDWVRRNRLLALVDRHGEYGLFVINIRPHENSSLIVNFDKVIPVNEHFHQLTDYTGYKADDDVYLKITFNETKLIFELKAGPKTDSFLSELKKACEGYPRKLHVSSEFHWIEKYRTMASRLSSEDLSQTAVDMFDPLKSKTPSKESVTLGFEDDFNSTHIRNSEKKDKPKPIEKSPSDSFNTIPRQSIAVGATHLAARESIVWLQMNSRRIDYTDKNNFRVFIGTWNVNGQSPSVSLTEWLSCDADPPDIYAVGFQELDLSKEAFVFSDSPREAEWLRAVENGLHSGAEYHKVKLIRLVGMMLIVFVRKPLHQHVANVGAETVGTGIMGKMGNKGGVGIRFEFHNTSMCFVNSHLAAHPDEYERRNQDFKEICARMVFPQTPPTTPKYIKDHEQIYWLGDLNYRINELDTATIKNHLNMKDYTSVFLHDQLKLQQSQEKAFTGFLEGPITFQPTYKYDLGSDVWDMGRSPAWCDRILWRGENILQKVYRSHPSLKISDHKPVSSVFESGIQVVDNVKYRRIYEDVMKQLDKLENEFLPQVTVDNMEVKFGVVKFIEPQTHFLTIANTGQVPVKFEFIKKPNEANYCKEWLSIKPCYDFIMPGEKCDVELEVYVDKRTAYKLNCQQDKIYDILVLHLEGGKDFFITISGTYQPTCFGWPLESLIHIHQPLCELNAKELAELATNGTPYANGNNAIVEPYDIPKEIWLLVDHLSRHGMDHEQLFEQPGLPQETLQIRDCLDTSMPLKMPGSINSVAEALLVFLEALPEPVIPYKYYQKCLDASQNYFQSQQIIEAIPVVHQTVFKYLMAFLKALLYRSDSNKLDAKSLSTLFAGILLRPANESKLLASGVKKNQASERKKAAFIYNFLVNDQIN